MSYLDCANMPGSSHSRSLSVSTRSDSGIRKGRITSRSHTGRSRPRTAATSTGYGDNEIICAITESRGISPTIGLSFVNLTTSEAVLCQFADTQTYARTCHKIKVFNPTEIIYVSTAAESKLLSILNENLEVDKFEIMMTSIDRRYWSESTGFEYVQHLAFPDDYESLKVSIGGNYFATCCFAAAMKYVELGLGKTFASQTLRIRFEPSEGSMMIDLSTIASLELIQNLQNTKSKDSLFGLLNETLTSMGARILRSNVLQPSTDTAKLLERYEAVGELATKEEMFFGVRTALAGFVDTDRCLSNLVILPTKFDFQYMEQSVNNVLMLKAFVDAIKPIWQALTGVTSEELQKIRDLCDPANYEDIEALIQYALNSDVTYAKQATELRNHRVYAIRAGVNCFLDVARQTYKEINDDAVEMTNELGDQHGVTVELKFDPARQYYFRIRASDFEDRPVPDDFINIVRKKAKLECQTLALLKMNQKIKDAHNEVVSMSDKSVQDLIDAVRSKIHPLFKISESLALLDMLAGMAQVVTTQDYIKPELSSDTLALKASRHPILDRIFPFHCTSIKLIPNDVYSTPQHRFQIITGANMSGKSTYIRSIALNVLLAQTGCFVPAQYASIPVFHQLFALLATDSNVEANVSSFASEMSSVAFILRNIEPRSLVIIDELGRGTSTTDGLAIAIAIAEALIASKAHVWFVTHFHDLPRILGERAGVVNYHLNVDIITPTSDPRRTNRSNSEDDTRSDDSASELLLPTKMKMTYRIASGPLPPSSQYYGLTLARTISLPPAVVEVATRVSEALHERNEARKSNPRAMAVARRRKLVLGLKEQLKQCKENWNSNGADGAEGLREWLKRLQDEFIVRLDVIAAEADAEALTGRYADEDDRDDLVDSVDDEIHIPAYRPSPSNQARITGSDIMKDETHENNKEAPVRTAGSGVDLEQQSSRANMAERHRQVKQELGQPHSLASPVQSKEEPSEASTTHPSMKIKHEYYNSGSAEPHSAPTYHGRPISAATSSAILSGAEEDWAVARVQNESQYQAEMRMQNLSESRSHAGRGSGSVGLNGRKVARR